jgi:hypothetical protein
MNASTGEKTPSGGKEKSFSRVFVSKLRKRHIIETLAGFVAGGWLLIEVVERLLVGHYRFPEETIDLTVVSVIGALLSTLIWRWFRGTEKRPGNVKVEVLLVPLIILTALCIDLVILFDIAGISGKRLPAGIIALCLGIAWIIFKSLQWAAMTPEPSKTEAQAVQPAMSGAAKSLESKYSIAVLPFVDVSPERDQEYFCDGMTEELINRLSNIKGLRVPARTSAFMFKGKAEDIREIGRKLDVRTVLEGSIRKAGK